MAVFVIIFFAVMVAVDYLTGALEHPAVYLLGIAAAVPILLWLMPKWIAFLERPGQVVVPVPDMPRFEAYLTRSSVGLVAWLERLPDGFLAHRETMYLHWTPVRVRPDGDVLRLDGPRLAVWAVARAARRARNLPPRQNPQV